MRETQGELGSGRLETRWRSSGSVLRAAMLSGPNRRSDMYVRASLTLFSWVKGPRKAFSSGPSSFQEGEWIIW